MLSKKKLWVQWGLGGCQGSPHAACQPGQGGTCHLRGTLPDGVSHLEQTDLANEKKKRESRERKIRKRREKRERKERRERK